MIKFEKVSKDNFISSGGTEEEYNSIVMPKRATTGSAGYDLFTTKVISIPPNSSVTIPTGLKCQMSGNTFMMIVPRSGLGFKYKIQLSNTVGIVDRDYYNNESNEGHIFVKLFNDNREQKTITLSQGMAFAQAIFLPFLTTDDDAVSTVRTGGFGSTSK